MEQQLGQDSVESYLQLDAPARRQRFAGFVGALKNLA
jgi:hypothetical protein